MDQAGYEGIFHNLEGFRDWSSERQQNKNK